MNNYFFTFQVNNVSKSIEVKSKYFRRGKKKILFDTNLFNNKQMLKDGYLIKELPIGWFDTLYCAIESYIAELIKEAVTFELPNNFRLSKYHTFVNNGVHKKIISKINYSGLGNIGIPLNKLKIESSELTKFVNEAIESNYCLAPQINVFGFKKSVFWLRIVRPKSGDNNPPHKDVHLKRLRNCVNIYLPLAGSNQFSSLPLIPGSHKENENNYIVSDSPCYINDKRFTVPTVVHRDEGLKMITPNPPLKSLMIFTPSLIHGGGFNNNEDETRVSIEMRFFK